MITTSAEFAAKIENPPRHFTARLLYQGNDIGGSFRSLNVIKGSVNAEDGFTIGTVYSSTIEVTMQELAFDVTNKELALQIGLDLDDGTTEYINIGRYTPNSGNIKKTSSQITFTGLGVIASKFNNSLFTVTGSKTLSNIAGAISTATGVNVSFLNISDTSEVITESVEGLTCYEGLVLLATMVGGYATETNTGEVIITQYNSASNNVPVELDRMHSLPQLETEDLTITGVRVVVSESSTDEDGEEIEEESFVEGIPTISIQNTFMTQSIFDNLFKGNIIGYSYRPGIVPLALGDPRLEPMDNLVVEGYDGEDYIIPCHEIKHSFDGGIITEVQAASLTNNDDTSSSAGPVTQQLEKMNAQLITAQNAIFNRAKVTDLEATNADIDSLRSGEAYLQKAVIQDATITNLNVLNSSIGEALANTLTAEKITAVQTAIDNASITNITSDNISAKLATLDTVLANILTASELNAVKAVISQLTVENLAVNNLKARYAQIDGANITTATIRDAWVDKLMVQSGLIAHEGTVYILDAIQVNASSITAGTIDVDRLIVTVEGEKYLVHINPSTGTPSYQKLDGDVIEDLTITADKIVAGAITAEKITTENIVGSGGWINLRSGTFAYYNANYTSGIAWNGSSLTILADSIDISSAVSVAQDSADDIRRQVNGGSQIYWDVDNNEVLESFDIVTQDTVTDRVKTPYTDSEGNQYYQDAEGNISTDSSGTALYTVENVPLYIQSDDSIGSTVTAEPYLSTGLANDLEQIKGAISVNPSEPSISLGTEGANLKLTNDRLSFQQSSSDGSELVEVAYISSEEDLGTININNAKINSSLVIGELELCEVNGGIAVRRAM